jgi:hypothetical protein
MILVLSGYAAKKQPLAIGEGLRLGFLSKAVTPKPHSTDEYSPDTSCSGDNKL